METSDIYKEQMQEMRDLCFDYTLGKYAKHTRSGDKKIVNKVMEQLSELESLVENADNPDSSILVRSLQKVGVVPNPEKTFSKKSSEYLQTMKDLSEKRNSYKAKRNRLEQSRDDAEIKNDQVGLNFYQKYIRDHRESAQFNSTYLGEIALASELCFDLIRDQRYFNELAKEAQKIDELIQNAEQLGRDLSKTYEIAYPEAEGIFAEISGYMENQNPERSPLQSSYEEEEKQMEVIN